MSNLHVVPLVHIWDFYDKRVKSTVAFLGNAPHKVQTAAKMAADHPQKPSAVLSQHFGNKYRQVLGLPGAIAGGTTEENVIFTDSDMAAFFRPVERQKLHKSTKLQENQDLRVWNASSLSIFNFDKLSEVRDKIFAATGIPPYRQHIFCDGADYVMYRIILHGSYLADIRDVGNLQNVAGMPIDRYMVDNREAIRIEIFDPFKTADTLIWPVYVVDLKDIIMRNQTQIADAMKDSYQRQLIYYGFIIKYWPMLCFQCFTDYVKDEEDFLSKYPGFYQPLDGLLAALKKEAALLTSATGRPLNLPVAVTKLAATIKCPLYAVHLRSLFDGFVLSENCPAVHFYSDYQGGRYLIKKTLAGHNIKFPSFSVGKRMIPMVTIAVINSEDAARQSLIFVSIHENGACYLKTEWSEDQRMQISQLTPFLKSTINPVIDQINKNGAKIEKISGTNVVFKGMTVAVYWKKILNTKNFRNVVDSWAIYTAAGILTQRGVNTSEKVEFIFKKFMVNFDPTAVEKTLRASNDVFITNFYSYLSVGFIQAKWLQHYEGRKMTMVHRATDIKFEIIDIHESEFSHYYDVLERFCKAAERVTGNPQRTKVEHNQKLKALKETDPVLFNFVAVERNIKSVNTYSVACQKPMQPVIHDVEVPKSTKYWNFSTNKPVYYTCPNPTYSRLGFIKDIHPQHLCVPCCYKGTTDEESYKKSQSMQCCLKTHKHPGARSTTTLTHVLDYGKLVDPGRHTKLPADLFKLLNEQPQYSLLGIQQHLPTLRDIGVLFALSKALEESVPSLLRTWSEKVDGCFQRLLNGAIWDHFSSPSALVLDMLALADNKQVAMIWFNRWHDLFIDLARLISHVDVLQIVDPKGDGRVSVITSSVTAMNTIVILQAGSKSATSTYLLVKTIDNVTKCIFRGDDCTRAFAKMIDASITNKTQDKLIDLDLLSKICENRGKITDLYVNLAGYCYAVMLTLDDQQIYCPVNYSQNESVGNLVYTAYTGEPKIERATAEWFVRELQKVTGEGTSYSDCVVEETPFGFLCNNGGIIYCDMGVATGTYDPRLVTAAILSHEPPTVDKVADAPRALYEVYQYDLFLRETVRYLSQSINSSLRSRLASVVNVKKIDQNFRSALKQLLADYPADLKNVWLIIDNAVRNIGSTDLTKINLDAAFQRVRFTFDRELVIRINKMSVIDAKATLLALTPNYIKYDANAHITEFPNVRTCCANMSPAPNYCDKDKLIITGDLNTFCELAVVDLRNPIKNRHLFDISDVQITSYFDFIKRPNESIEIIKMANI